jgi:NAD(P)-dependent dehydrogenase (short-subunit alcohol dehydrogenase family)
MAGLVNAFRTTLSENLGGVAQSLAPAATRFSIDAVPDQTGKVAVVTGGSAGIGYGVSHTLLTKNIAKVFILSDTKEVVDKAKDAVREELGEEAANRTQWVQCDLGDWKRTVAAAKEITSATDRLDILVNNAGRGIMTFQLTDDGLDRHMAVNHMGHVVLTANLLPLLKKTAEQGNTVRITNQASNLHTGAPSETKFASVEELNKDYGPNPQYGRAKLAAILFSRFLARHLTSVQPRILVNATHPGIVETKMSQQDIHEPFPLGGYGMSVGLQPFKKNQFDGALSTLYAATKIEDSGEYICPPAAREPGSQQSQDEQLGEQLMRLTAQLIKEKIGEDLPSEFQPN